MRSLTLAAALVLSAAALPAQQVSPAIYTDPPRDTAHPARMEVLHIPSGDVRINGVAYLAAGAGTHPTIVLAHGLPGNEKNLDLAQAVRRAGWNAVTFNYRGRGEVPARSALRRTWTTRRRCWRSCAIPRTCGRWASTPRGWCWPATAWGGG